MFNGQYQERLQNGISIIGMMDKNTFAVGRKGNEILMLHFNAPAPPRVKAKGRKGVAFLAARIS
jgi:hypothetical protein